MTSGEENAEHYFTVEKLNGPNFWRWRNNILMLLTYLDLDDLVLSANPSVSGDGNNTAKKKQAAAIIRQHLDDQNAIRFVDDPSKFEPKELWDAICGHYAAPTRANAFELMDRLYGIKFVEGSFQESITEIRETSRFLFEVSQSYFDRKTLELHWIFFIRTRLPACFRHVGSEMMKRDDGNESLDNYLLELELEIRRQERAQQIGLACAGKQPSPSSDQHRRRPPRAYCKNGVHNPHTHHSAANCNQLHPKKIGNQQGLRK
ncbi:hypothetical protein PGT21_050085 [Puccinia graminis f. sp. tritici]|uniref:Retrotransposon Copia-like N-terminal domain-containing protein n=2 Tax=Puccinia graminis f. sp. tritici TaxID=56615 RepID=E3KDR2_PUCGT|nr:uncharacterized protein PGTG_08454 [Puccinia graminis f. sp. tritici CRL 75-36-700-3]EFP82498.1 hypothetical protein PGTG_08454 [Puccinia graminis f. sp. tritici CRL 75-36-700-3]KAA1079696.1 hypothetical protein PGT21_050085 [Puccinia graminis f. sp. tritici]